jgi:hypothetical protein
LGSDQESLNKRIRETLSGLSDEDLINILRTTAKNYTPFAHQVAEEELSRRRQLKATRNSFFEVGVAGKGALRNRPADDKHSGCYVEVWSDKNFEGEYMRIEGPVEHPALDFSGLNWGNTISSLRVGPNAFVLMYADPDFKGGMMSFGPSQEVADLEELGFNDEVDSIRLVNSMKVFDGLREEDTTRQVECSPEGKRSNQLRRAKKQRGRR